MREKFLYAILIVVFIAFMLAISLGAWYVSRKVNYSFSYKSMVEQTVKDMVKDECLKRSEKK
jgi:hypothetical protein